MKLLWLCNNAPGVVRAHISGKEMSGVNWVDHVLSGLRSRGFTVRVLYRGTGEPGTIDETCSYAAVSETPAHIYVPELEEKFREEIRSFQPDVIHSWGVEYHHALAMVNAAEAEGKLNHMVASIQGLCRYLAEHYTDGLPEKVCRGTTFRDYLRKDNILQQQEKFVLRGQLETRAMEKLQHVIGRTDWDRAKAVSIHPDITYHFCNETLRENFYEGHWDYSRCKRHSVFASSCSYPIKGFHYLLEAFAQVVKTYPDATLSLPGNGFPKAGDWKGKLRATHYQNYLAQLVRSYGLEDRISFRGGLSAEQMRDAYLDANVFVIPSTIENSPNTLGEAMLLGVPCVASDVGGVTTLLKHGEEGFVCPSTAPYMLAWFIEQVFAMEEKAGELGTAARNHAQKLHDPGKNHRDLMQMYAEIRR